MRISPQPELVHVNGLFKKQLWSIWGFGLTAILLVPATGAAQQGFALKAGPVFNSSDVREEETSLRLSDAAGWGAGIEYVLPLGIALGVSGYTAGSPNDFDLSEGSLVMLADA